MNKFKYLCDILLHMQNDRQVVYAPDALVIKARANGMTNLSGFVREKLKEYNETVEGRQAQTTAADSPRSDT